LDYTILSELANKIIVSLLQRDAVVETEKVALAMDIEIDIPKDIVADKKRLKKVQDGILKAIRKGPYEEGLAFRIMTAKFKIPSNVSKNKPESG